MTQTLFLPELLPYFSLLSPYIIMYYWCTLALFLSVLSLLFSPFSPVLSFFFSLTLTLFRLLPICLIINLFQPPLHPHCTCILPLSQPPSFLPVLSLFFSLHPPLLLIYFCLHSRCIAILLQPPSTSITTLLYPPICLYFHSS